MRDRRGGGKNFLPPPPGTMPARRDDRGFMPNRGPRRRRSPSPGFRRGGSPPFKRGRYGGRDDEIYGNRGYGDRFYGRSPPRERDGPRTYKDFCRTLPDDVTPEEAQREYQQYLSEYWGSEVRADFESKKNEDWMKRRFDPRGMRIAMEERNEQAKESSRAFLESLNNGEIDPKSETFNQGSTSKAPEEAEAESSDEEEGAEDKKEDKDGEEKKAETKAAKKYAPEVCWKLVRLLSDLQLSQQLILKLDEEKGITENTLVPKPDPEPEAKPEAPEETAEPAKSENKDPEIKADDENAEVQGEDALNSEDAEMKDIRPSEDVNGASVKVEDPVKEEKPPVFSSRASGDIKPSKRPNVEETIQKLDVQLMYLWKVHSIDYYAAKENADPMYYALCSTTERLFRGIRPEEGEKNPDEQAEKKALKKVEKQIEQVWKKRLISGDPFEVQLQEEKADRLLDEWVNDQVKKIDDNKWGCKLSQKLFVGRDYVLKHIRLKHTEKMEDQRTKILDEFFWENYKKFREEEKKLMQAELEKMQQTIHLQKQGVPSSMLPMPWDGKQPGPGGRDMDMLAKGGSLLPGGRMLPGMVGPPVVPGPGAMMPQPGQVLVLAPGAGPMGPFISVPMAEAGLHRPLPGIRPPPRGMMPAEGPRGMYPGAGSAAAGRGGYFDLDNPTNNRSVLDYGDL